MEKDVVELSTIENPADKLNLPSFGTLENLQTNIANQAKTSSEALSGLQTKETDLEKQLNDLLTTGGTQSARQAELEKLGGVPATQQRISDITSQLAILGRNLDTAQIQADTQARGTLELSSFLDTTKQNIRNQAAVQSNRLLAEQAQLQGNVETAQRFIEAAIKAEFEPIKTAISIKQQQLEAIRDDLTRAETRDWNVQDRILKEQERQVIEQEKEQKEVNELALTLGQNGAPASVVQKALNAKSYAELAKDPNAIYYLQDPLTRIKVSQAYADSLLTNTALNMSSNPVLQNIPEVGLDVYGTLSQLIKESNDKTRGFNSAVGRRFLNPSYLFGIKGEPIAGTQAADFTFKADRLVNLLSADNLDKLKGAMSDKDIVFLKSLGTSLDTKMSESEFKAELKNIESKLKQKYGLNVQEYSNAATNPLGLDTTATQVDPEKDPLSLMQ